MTQLVVLQNQSTTVTDAEVERLAEAFKIQAVRDYNTSGWVKRKLAPAINVQYIGRDTTVPPGAWPLFMRDSSDQPGALGYHDDTGTTPYGLVFAVDTRNAGLALGPVVSHEGLEMTVDPWVDPMQPRVVQKPGTDQQWIVEVGDPVQGGIQTVTLADGSTEQVQDFALPAWWQIQNSIWRPTSRYGDVSQPWEVDPQGYMSYEVNGQWKQIYGRFYHGAPDPDDPAVKRHSFDSRHLRRWKAIYERGVEAFSPREVLA